VWAQHTGNRAAGVKPLLQRLDAACEEVGRDPATLQRTAAVMVDLPGAYGRPGQTVPSLLGSPEELSEEMRGYAREGISHVQLYPDPCTVAGIEALAPMLELLDKD
jgi:alkanesulfonate monooxygenase SsuD/methylene tetrahydromethanopterin reductase-like flavin-dependent oxidoreductase (luciferase family)